MRDGRGHLTRRGFLERALAATVVLHGCLRLGSRHPSVVCVLVDQLRKDAADRWLTRVSALAGRGVVFDGMRSVAPWTYPSVVSLMSGLYPQQHGADGHLREDTLTTFGAEVPLVHRTLRDAGYATAAFVTNPFLHDWNPFHRGFDRFEAGFVHSIGNARGFPRAVWDSDRMFAQTVNASILDHFRGRARRRPEFTYIHYIDVHGPWEGAPFPPSYEGAVRFIDERIAELHRFFEERYDGDLLFFVTADHGMALGDDEQVGLGLPWRTSKLSMFDFNLRIPFVVLPGRRVPEGRVVAGPCSNIDFVPTLADWIGVRHARELPGRSLLPAIRGEAEIKRGRPIYARVSAFGHRSDAMVKGDRKYVRFFGLDDGRVTARHVFDPTTDPREVTSLGERFGSEAGALFGHMAGPHGVAYAARFDEPPPNVRDGLRALGYLQ